MTYLLIAPLVFRSFFTLVGATIDFQTQRLGVAGSLASIRIIGVIIGCYSGGTIAREPWQRTKLSWATRRTRTPEGHVALATYFEPVPGPRTRAAYPGHVPPPHAHVP